jgi:hypothetical protein
MAQDYYACNHLDTFLIKIAQSNPELYPSGTTGYEQYYIDLQSLWRELYNPNPDSEDLEKYFAKGHPLQYWHKNLLSSPQSLNFWIDFLDGSGELDEFSVKNIGIRSKVDNNKDVRSIYYKEIPKVIFETDR